VIDKGAFRGRCTGKNQTFRMPRRESPPPIANRHHCDRNRIKLSRKLAQFLRACRSRVDCPFPRPGGQARAMRPPSRDEDCGNKVGMLPELPTGTLQLCRGNVANLAWHSPLARRVSGRIALRWRLGSGRLRSAIEEDCIKLLTRLRHTQQFKTEALPDAGRIGFTPAAEESTMLHNAAFPTPLTHPQRSPTGRPFRL
jgi:hypothetical protein